MNSQSDKVLESPILDIQNMTRRFGGLVAVNQVNLQVQEREIFGIIGPNGAGKTTLFNMITGLLQPSSGQMIYQGQDITQRKPFEIAAQGIARTFQNLRLFKNLSVIENVEIAHHIHNKTNFLEGTLGLKKARLQEEKTYKNALELLALVGLVDYAEQTACNLSYGDQRRLEIARALALKPKVLLLDEPAAGMNHTEKAALSEFIRQIRTQFQLTVLLIEHHVPLVMGLCDRIAVLDFGQLIALGKPEVVKNDPAVIEAYLGDE
jgi:branched-chain amino acid transport system ATP-binding protein